MLKSRLKQILRKSGYEIRKYTSNDEHQNLIKILRAHQIQTVLDVGANVGQYSTRLRTLGFSGLIHSFEPLPDAFRQLSAVARSDDKWNVYNHALGNDNASVEINQSANSYSSSILDMEATHLEVAPQSKVVSQVTIEVKRLDDVIHNMTIDSEVFLKVDTQGYEKHVLDGAESSLKGIKGVQLEMSLVPLYTNEFLFRDLLDHMQSLNFELYQLIPGLVDNRDGRLLQVDGIFIKK